MDWGCQCEASPLRVRRLALSHSVAGVAQVPQFPPPAAPRPGAAVGRQGVRDYEPAHLVLGEVFLCGSWTAQGPIGCRPGRYRASVGYHSEPGVLCYYGGSGCLCPCSTGGCLSLLPVWGLRRPNVVALGYLVRLSRSAR